MFTHVSAIRAIHELCDITDPTQAFVTKKNSERCQTIAAPILQKLYVALEHTVSQYPVKLLLRALFLMAFYAFLRL